jgi:hypothetical protein
VSVEFVDKDEQYILNHCTKYLARDSTDPRHDFGQYDATDSRSQICEAWRFPIIDSHWDGKSADTSYVYNDVTFVFDGRRRGAPSSVAVVGTFAELFSPVPLKELQFLGEDTGFFAVTVRVGKGQVHNYKYVVDGQYEVDPINPQTTVLDNGQRWSRFFTDACQIPLALSRRERDLLQRLAAHLLPFRLEENSLFIREVYNRLDRSSRTEQFPLAYRLDEEVGVTNYIDKLVAREEMHNAYAYHTCLDIIDRLLRTRYGGQDPTALPAEMYADLYAEMETDRVDGWDTDRYRNPQYFLLLLRRHVLTGAFVHPKHGGNSGAAGWMYLEDRFRDPRGQTLFDWRQALEVPLGHNTDYRG